MRIITSRQALLLIFGTFVTLSAGQAAAQSAASDDPAMYRGPDREQRLLDGARREGEVTVYSSMIVRHLSCWLLAQESNTKSYAQTWFGPVAGIGLGRPLAMRFLGRFLGT